MLTLVIFYLPKPPLARNRLCLVLGLTHVQSAVPNARTHTLQRKQTGMIAGCTAVPALIVALMLRVDDSTNTHDREAAFVAYFFHLRLAVSCSAMFIAEAVLGDGRWGGRDTAWRQEVRPASTPPPTLLYLSIYFSVYLLYLSTLRVSFV